MIEKWKLTVAALIAGTSLVLLFQCSSTDKTAFLKINDRIPAFVKDTQYQYAGNTYTDAKAELGRYLFYDRRLSVNNTKACASCHAQQFSFTDGYNRSIGVFGDLHQRNSRPLINLIFNKYLTAADSTLHFPEEQINNPMMNQHPVEMGIAGNENEILNRIKADSFYQQQFRQAFATGKDSFSLLHVQQAISTFIKTIFSFNSPFDRYTYMGEQNAMNAMQLNGKQLFFSDSLSCSKCHGGINFTRPAFTNADGSMPYYFTTGLYNVAGRNTYPAYDQGLIMLTKSKVDQGRFLLPTLRNLAFTAPYFHDGSAATLEDVLNVYERGGRNIENGPYAGDGRKNIHNHSLIKGFQLNSQQRKDLIAFLLSLSDSSLCNNPAYANPFNDEETIKQELPK
jgi:cytochrome c peroxidase